MATLCTHCGAELKEDARFCKTCGTLVPSHPLSPRSLGASTPVGLPYERTTTAAREQSESQPSPRSVHPTPKEEPPFWMSQLENPMRHRNSIPPGSLPRNRQEKFLENAETNQLGKPQTPQEEIKNGRVSELPTAALPVPIRDASSLQKQATPTDQPSQQDVSSPTSVQQPGSPLHELHVKVWDRQEPASPAVHEGESSSTQTDDFDDLPTRPLAAGSPGLIVQRSSTTAPMRKVQDPRVDELERLDTARLAAQPAVPAFREIAQPWRGTGPQQLNSSQRLRQQPDRAPVTYAHLGNQPMQDRPGMAPALPIQDLKQTPPPQYPAAPVKRRKGRKPLALGLLVLLLLAVGGGATAWIVIYQPFSVPVITQPRQIFNDQQLGLMLQYPTGWHFQHDRGKSSVHFYDSSHTAQVNIVVSPANGSDPASYLQQEAGQIGVTGQKAGASLIFAGVSWHQLRGNVQQNGATYTEALLVTSHNQRFFTIMFLAPQTIYTQEDQIVFSQIRSTFQFLS